MREEESAYVTWINNKIKSDLHWWLKEGHVGHELRFKVYTTKGETVMFFEDLKNGTKEEVTTSSEAFELADGIIRQEKLIKKYGPKNNTVKSVENRLKELIKKL
jgi:hypothetical protein